MRRMLAIAVLLAGIHFSASAQSVWTQRGPLPQVPIMPDFSWVAWNGSVFTAASGQFMRTSKDGINWSGHSTNDKSHFFVAWGGGRFVAVGTEGNVASSADGEAWTSHSTGTLASLSAAAWTGKQWVVVGGYGALLTSPDGIEWTLHDPQRLDLFLYCVVWTGKELVAAGAGGVVMRSPDGISWTEGSLGSTDVLRSMVWTGTQIVGVGVGGIIYTSPDGSVWTARNSGVNTYLTHSYTLNHTFRI